MTRRSAERNSNVLLLLSYFTKKLHFAQQVEPEQIRAAAVCEILKLGLTIVATSGAGAMKSFSYGIFGRGPDRHKQPDAEPDAAD